MIACTMPIPIRLSRLNQIKSNLTQVCIEQEERETRGFGLENEKYIFLNFYLLRLIGIGIVQTTMSISTLPLSILKLYIKKKHVYESGATVSPYNQLFSATSNCKQCRTVFSDGIHVIFQIFYQALILVQKFHQARVMAQKI